MYQKGKDKGFLGAHRWELIDWSTFCSKKSPKTHIMKSQGFDDIFWHPNKWNLIKRNAKKHTSNRNPWSIHWNYAVCQCSGILHLLSLNLEKRRRESGKLFDVEKGHFPIPPPFKDNWQRHGGDSSKGIREWILSQCFIEQLYLQTFPFDTFQKWWKGPDQPSPHFESWYVTNSKTSHDLRGGLATQSPT